MSATSRAGRAMAGGLRRRRLLGVSPRTLAARHAQAIERALDLGDQPGGNARVAGRRLQLLVSEQRLNHANVRAALKQVGCEAVAKRMQRERFTQPRCFRCLLEQPSELACRQRPTFTATGKQPTLFRREAGGIRGRPHLPPLPQQLEDLCRQHQHRPAELSAEDLAIMALIDRQYLARPYYGSRRMAAWLATQGHVVN